MIQSIGKVVGRGGTMYRHYLEQFAATIDGKLWFLIRYVSPGTKIVFSRRFSTLQEAKDASGYIARLFGDDAPEDGLDASIEAAEEYLGSL